MSIEEQVKEEKRLARKVSEVCLKLEKYRIKNVSEFVIMSYIKIMWNNSFKDDKENYKNIVRQIILDRIAQRRRQIIVHSCIYYHFNKNVISDIEYDNLSKELVDLQIRFPKISEEAALFKYFKDWHTDIATSGFNLPYNNIKVITRAKKVIELSSWYTK